MSRRDKDQLITLLAIAVIIATTIALCFFTKVIPWYVVFGIVLIGQFIVIAPRVYEQYYVAMDVTPSPVQKWIPVLNEIQIMNSKAARVSTIACIICIMCLAVYFIPNNVIGSIFGLKAGMFWKFNSFAFLIIALIIFNFVIAFGLCGVFRNVNIMVMEHFNSQPMKIEYIYYVLMLMPCVRICALIAIKSKLTNLKNSGYGAKDDTVFVKQQED